MRMFDRILVIDEDESLRESMALMLSEEGYDVLTADQGEQALALIESSAVDAVLCDLRMPGLDGFDLLPQIERQIPGAPIILMWADGSEDLAVEAIQRGAYDCLSKPVQPTERAWGGRSHVARPGRIVCAPQAHFFL